MEHLYFEMMDIRESCVVEKSGKMVLNGDLYRYWCTTEMSKRNLELLPKVRKKFDEYVDKATLVNEGLNFDMPEALFFKRAGRVKDSRYQWGNFGIIGIKFNCKEHVKKDV